ncbi:kinase-like domain-containing protein [Gigaspora rosea]|uniref:Kinase-like domain-containing protein n=1 Tax=Gigaspora rosea TaxID=44941 RepID=A0A397W258_9GLOM|nr:kinase-like domain-containing protein [Gigaspora rosea]
MDWKEKLTLLRYIANDLQIIHSQELVHRNLHSGNILQNHLHDAYIADLGLSIPLNGESHGVYGILPYIAPEILNGGQYTTSSDIYSFGIILWEILYGNSISYNQAFGTELQIKICHNKLRPTIIKDSPQCYIDLMQQCWDRDPTKRPSAKKLCETFIKWKNDDNILLELTKSDILMDFNKTNIQIYPDNVYKSKFINYTTSYYQEGNYI